MSTAISEDEEAIFADLAALPISHFTLSHTPIAPDTVLTAEEFFLLAHAEWRSEEASFFHSLISSSDTAPLLAWLESGHDVNTRDSNNLTLLLYAIRHCAPIEVVEELLKAEADPNLPDGNGITPLMWAADVNAPVEIITALIEAGAEVNAHAHEDYVSAISLAALSRTSKPSTILTLLKAGAKMPSGIFNLLADDPNAPEFPDFDYMYFDFIESKSVPSYLVDPDYPGPECPIYEHFYVSNGPRSEPQYTFNGYHLIDPIPDDPEPQPTEAYADAESNAPFDSDESQLLTAQDETVPESAIPPASSSCAMTACVAGANENDTILSPHSAEDDIDPEIFKDFPKPITDVVCPCTTDTTVFELPSAPRSALNPVPSSVPEPLNEVQGSNKGRMLYSATSRKASTPRAPKPKEPRFPAPKTRRWQTEGGHLLSPEELSYLVRTRLNPRTSCRSNSTRKHRKPLAPFLFIVAGAAIIFVFLMFVIIACA